MTTPATLERRRLAEELLAVGPDAPTLCEGWTTRDLAAHIVLRDTRPDAMPGILIPALSGYADRVQSRIARRDWDRLVDRVRSGPPLWSPTRLGPVDRLANTAEFFVHTEDVLRAADGWEPRDLPADLVDDLFGALRRAGSLAARKAPVGVVLRSDDGREEITAKKGSPNVTVSGPVGELVLWLYGRQGHARVTVEGPDEAIAALDAAEFGV